MYKKVVIIPLVFLLVFSGFPLGQNGEVIASSGKCKSWDLATDDDFSGSFNGSFKYTGNSKCVEIPHTIKGVSITSYSGMFREYQGSQLGVKSTNSNIVNMSGMFSRASSLTELDLSNFDTSNVVNMSDMFYLAESLTELDLSSFNTSKVENMTSMFHNARSLIELDLSGFNTSNVTSMVNMFYNGSSLERLDLSNFNTSNVTNMRNMFGLDNGRTSNIEELDLSSFDTSNVTDVRSMFINASKLKRGVANKQSDADKLNSSSGKPSGVTFYPKGRAVVSLDKKEDKTWKKNHSVPVSVDWYSASSSGRKILYFISESSSPPGVQNFETLAGSNIGISGTGKFYVHVFGSTVEYPNGGPIETVGPFYVDNTPPNKPAIKNVSTGWQSSPVNLTIEGNGDQHSGVSRLEYSTNGTSWSTYNNGVVLGDGQHQLRARAVDSAGNYSQIDQKEIKIDTVTPGSPKVSGYNGQWTNSPVTLQLSKGATGQSGGQEQYKVGSGSWQNGKSVVVSGNGQTTVRSRVISGAGKASPEVVTTVKIDSLNPTVNIQQSSPAPGEDLKLTLKPNFNESPKGTVEVVGVGGPRTVQNGGSTEFSVKQNGTYQIKLKSESGSESSTTVKVSNIDKSLRVEAPESLQLGTFSIGDSKNPKTEAVVDVYDYRDSGEESWSLHASSTDFGLPLHINNKPSGGAPVVIKNDIQSGTKGKLSSKVNLEVLTNRSDLKKGSYSGQVQWSLVSGP